MTSFNWPPQAGGNQIVEYANFAAFPSAASAGNGAFAFALDTQTLYVSNGTTWTAIASPGAALSVGTFDSGTPSANGAHIDTNQLIMQSASGTVPGLVNLGAQTFAGNKTFTGTISASNLSGTNTGDVTIGTANGLSLVGQALSLGVSSTSTTGALTSTDWNTFNGKQSALTFGNLTDVGTDGITITNGTGAVIGTGTAISQRVSNTSQSGYLSAADWNTFNGKQNALTTGNLTANATAGLSVTGGTGAVIGSGAAVSQQAASTTLNGYLTSTDWNTFNGKQATISLAAVGASPNANAATLTGAVLNLELANGSFPGVVSTAAQTFAGSKTFSAALLATANTASSSTTTGTIIVTGGIGVSGAVYTSGVHGDTNLTLNAHGAGNLVFMANGSQVAQMEGSSQSMRIGVTTPTLTAERMTIVYSSTLSTGNVAGAVIDNKANATVALTGSMFGAFIRTSRTIVTSVTDTGEIDGIRVDGNFTVPAAQTLTNTSTAGFSAYYFGGTNAVSGAYAYTNFSAFQVAADSMNTGTNKFGLRIGALTGATNNYAIQTSAGIVSLGAAFAKRITAPNITTSTTIDSTYHAVIVDASGGAVTITLPTAASCFSATNNAGFEYVVKKVDASANNVTIKPNGAETIDGAASKIISAQYGAIRFQTNGTTWWIV